MLQDKLLLRRFKAGSSDALCRIYRKYADYLLTLATVLLNDHSAAEDVLHDVFCSFIQRRQTIKLKGSLKSYLATCVANLSRDRIRSRNVRSAQDITESIVEKANRPDQSAIQNEQSQKLRTALMQLPFHQREVVIFHLRAGMKFRQIAHMQDTSVNTAKSRYRYGLAKLRTILNSEPIK